MGYHIVLLRSPPKAITWKQLSTAARKIGWQADVATHEVRLSEGDRLLARVTHGDGEPWCKLMDETELAHVIRLVDELGARARGDEFESYRSVDDWYVHPDDQAEKDAAQQLVRKMKSRSLGRNLWDGFRILVLIYLAYRAMSFVIRELKG